MQAYYGIEIEELWRLATGLGAGLSRRQDVCGALTGGMVACGLVTGRQRASAREQRIALRDEVYTRCQDLGRRFEAKFGTVTCREMVGCDFGTAEGRQQFKDTGRLHAVCEPAIALAIEGVIDLCR